MPAASRLARKPALQGQCGVSLVNWAITKLIVSPRLAPIWKKPLWRYRPAGEQPLQVNWVQRRSGIVFWENLRQHRFSLMLSTSLGHSTADLWALFAVLYSEHGNRLHTSPDCPLWNPEQNHPALNALSKTEKRQWNSRSERNGTIHAFFIPECMKSTETDIW